MHLECNFSILDGSHGASRGARQTSQLPLTRVKNIIKSDPDITLASQEATLIISKVCCLQASI